MDNFILEKPKKKTSAFSSLLKLEIVEKLMRTQLQILKNNSVQATSRRHGVWCSTFQWELYSFTALDFCEEIVDLAFGPRNSGGHFFSRGFLSCHVQRTKAKAGLLVVCNTNTSPKSNYHISRDKAYLNFPKAFFTLVSMVMSKATTLPGAKLSKYTSKVLFPFCSARQVWK